MDAQWWYAKTTNKYVRRYQAWAKVNASLKWWKTLCTPLVWQDGEKIGEWLSGTHELFGNGNYIASRLIKDDKVSGPYAEPNLVIGQTIDTAWNFTTDQLVPFCNGNNNNDYF